MKDQPNWQQKEDPYVWWVRNPITRWPYMLVVLGWVYRPHVNWNNAFWLTIGLLLGATIAFHIAGRQVHHMADELHRIYEQMER